MRSLKFFAIFGFLLVYVHVVGATEGRTCVRDVEYTEKRSNAFWWATKYVKKTRKGTFCCDGYNPIHNLARHFIEVKSVNDCIPFCSPKCPPNSTCQPPTSCECKHNSEFYANHYMNRCKCNKGFLPTLTGHCTPICPDHCANGTCNELICTCNEGYKVNSHQKCIPECNGACNEYQECTSPGRCTLKPCKEPGYERNEINECVPKCKYGCLNGKCTAPETCICNEGYQKNEVTTVCEANCDNCTNGFCMVPQECLCSFGYKNVEGFRELLNNIDWNSTIWLLLGLTVGVLLVVALVTLWCCLRTKTAPDSDKSERIDDAEPIVESDISQQQPCVEAVRAYSNTFYEDVGEASTIVIGQGAMPMSGQDLINKIEIEDCKKATKIDEPEYLKLF